MRQSALEQAKGGSWPKRLRRMPVGGGVLASALLLLAALQPCQAEPPAKKQKQTKQKPALTKKWKVLWNSGRQPGGRRPLPENSPLENFAGLTIVGVPNADPFWLANFKVDGFWGSFNRRLQRLSGKNTALKLARAENFELQGVINAEGRGGWFFLVGLNDGHGYVIYNPTLRESGSPWIWGELRDSAIIEETHRELRRFYWKGEQPLLLTVIDKKLTLQAGREKIVADFDLPNYHAGDIVLGTYQTPYGPKPVSIRSLRIRGR